LNMRLGLLLASLAPSLVMGEVIVETTRNLRPFRMYEDLPARFGSGLPDEGLVGFLVVADPVTACTPIKPPPDVKPHIENVHWVALIRRSDSGEGEECTFQQKIQHAMLANFSAVIVFNYKDDILIPMGGDRDDVIPSVFVGHTDGAKMMAHYTYAKGRGAFVVRLTDNQPFDINAYLLPFAIVVGICFIIMLGIMIFKCVQDRRRERRHRLPKSSLKKIPTKKFVAGDEAHYETCCICLDDYVIGDKLRILPCQHAYHMKCIDPWLLKNKRVCPQCRKKVFASGEAPPSDSESETEDERAPLLQRPRAMGPPSGTFQLQNENPFRRAARRLASRTQSRLTSDGRGGVTIDHGEDSDSTEAGDEDEEVAGASGIMGNQLLAEVHIEQPTTRQADSPTFNRAAMEEEKEEEEEEDEEGDAEDQRQEQEVRVLPNPSTADEEPIV